ARGLPVSIYLHQGGHGGNPPADMLNRWFSHYLYGVDNGVEKDPPVWIVQDVNAQAPQAMAAATKAAEEAARGGAGADAVQPAGRGRGRGRGMVTPPTPFASFPVPGAVPVAFHPTAGGTGITNLSFSAASGGSDKLVDDVAMSGSADATADQSQHRLLY